MQKQNTLLKPPFSMIISASCGSGKSHLIKFLCGYLARKRLINTIIVFTNTKGVSDDYDWLDENRVFNDKYEERLGGIFKFQEMHPHSQLLLVFDDVLGAVKLESKNMTVVLFQAEA